jgi:AraC-like DNA-binding protein
VQQRRETSPQSRDCAELIEWQILCFALARNDSVPMPEKRPSTLVQHTISIVQIERMLQGAVLRGLDVDALLRRAGIPAVLLQSPLARVSQQQYAALIRVLIRVLGDEFWALGSSPVRIGTFATACRLMTAETTLGAALKAGLAHYHLMLDDFVPRLQMRDKTASVELVSRTPWTEPLGFAQSTFLFCGLGVASWLVARKLPLTSVRLCNQRARYNTQTSWLFGTEVQFGQAQAGLSFDAKLLDLPVIQTSATLAAFLQEAPASLLVKYRDQTSAAERTRRLLRRHIRTRLLTLEEISGMLAMTPQTLRRRLQEEGQGFQAIKDDLRRDMAIEYLAQPDLALQDIAELVGFSETSTFHRAFKSWTSVAPGAYRQIRLQAEDSAIPTTVKPNAPHVSKTA